MTVQLTGPRSCAECGSQFTEEIIKAGGSQPAMVIIRGHHIDVPGLYRCTGCDEAIKMGAPESGVTIESARDYLNDIFGPMVTGGFMIAVSKEDAEMAAMALERLSECMEVQDILEACIAFQAETGGLDFIPECDGNCGNHADPRTVAHLN